MNDGKRNKERDVELKKNYNTVYLDMSEKFTWNTELRRDETTVDVVFFEITDSEDDNRCINNAKAMGVFVDPSLFGPNCHSWSTCDKNL